MTPIPEAVAVELEAILAAIDDARFGRRCRGVRDWPRLVEAAFEHGVAAFLIHRLAQVGIGPPSADCDALAGRLAADRLWHRRLARELDRALAALARDGIRAVALKGVLLGERLYPEPHLRHALDLDLLVTPSDFDAARRVLLDLGYHDAAGPEAGRQEAGHHVEMSGPSGLRLELHHRASSGFAAEVPAAELVARARRYRTRGGVEAWILEPEDELLYLAVHAARHRLERLGMLVDLRLILERHPDLDWTLLGARARCFGVRHAVAVAFLGLERRLDVDLADRVRRAALPHGLRLRTAYRLIRPPGPGPWLRATLFRFGGVRQTYRALLADRAADGWRVWLPFMIRRFGRAGRGRPDDRRPEDLEAA